MREAKDYQRQDPTWCPGCGIFGIFDALKKAASSLGLEPEEVVIVTGIGCHGRLSNYFKAYGFHALHGRTLPVASGIKLSNPELSVVAVSGDGDAYSIGLNHLIHSVRRNISITYIVVDNRVYALTQGQTSPTSPMGFVSVSTPQGSKELPLDGPRLALASGGTFIARGFSGNPVELASLLERAVKHRGFSLVEVLSPCITHNKVNTYRWFRDSIEWLDKDKSYNPNDKNQAFEKLNQGKKIPVGLIYSEDRPSFEDQVLPEKEKPIALSELKVDAESFKKIMSTFY